MNTTVSVIVPTYNRAQFLQQCLDSILQQTYPPNEVIVVDDGSEDTTNEVLQLYGKRILVLHIPHCGVPGIVRNTGIEIAKGDFIAFCDADDYWAKEKLSEQLKSMEQTGANCCVTDAHIIGDEESTLLTHHPFRSTNMKKELLRNNFFITSSVILHRSLLQDNKFPTSWNFRGYEDYILWLRLVEKLKIDLIRKPLVYYRKHEVGVSSEVRGNDASIQLKILFSIPFVHRHPIIWTEKVLRYTYQILRR